MKKDTFVYAYKGVLGIKSAEEKAGLLNFPNEKNDNLCLINMDNVKFSKEAIELLNKIPVGTQSIGDIMCYVAGNTKVFGFKCGASLITLKVIGKVRPVKENYVPVMADIGYNTEILVPTEGIEPDESFKTYVDKLETSGELEKYILS